MGTARAQSPPAAALSPTIHPAPTHGRPEAGAHTQALARPRQLGPDQFTAAVVTAAQLRIRAAQELVPQVHRQLPSILVALTHGRPAVGVHPRAPARLRLRRHVRSTAAATV